MSCGVRNVVKRGSKRGWSNMKLRQRRRKWILWKTNKSLPIFEINLLPQVCLVHHKEKFMVPRRIWFLINSFSHCQGFEGILSHEFYLFKKIPKSYPWHRYIARRKIFRVKHEQTNTVNSHKPNWIRSFYGVGPTLSGITKGQFKGFFIPHAVEWP